MSIIVSQSGQQAMWQVYEYRGLVNIDLLWLASGLDQSMRYDRLRSHHYDNVKIILPYSSVLFTALCTVATKWETHSIPEYASTRVGQQSAAARTRQD